MRAEAPDGWTSVTASSPFPDSCIREGYSGALSGHMRGVLSDVAGRQAVLLQIALMVVFRYPEGGRGHDLRDDWFLEPAGLVKDLPGLLGQFLLLVVVVEDRRPVLRSHIRALAIGGGRVVVVPEDVEQRVVAHQCWIELDLDHFGVSGGVAAHFFVCGIGLRPAFISCGRGSDAGNLLEGGLRPPEASGTKCCLGGHP